MSDVRKDRAFCIALPLDPQKIETNLFWEDEGFPATLPKPIGAPMVRPGMLP